MGLLIDKKSNLFLKLAGLAIDKCYFLSLQARSLDQRHELFQHLNDPF
eukprot:CAMPEP_0168318486 /NCGR_PEP_ID=MMETSP0213-20121227/508_1 /TAXON_ID=151035 /ORGANISM="Euplotes harpa, Strain FSP1.4" /LENGTH=47 /DNA_ID= /DNA_START= /DNA_END= /DNA_ORIENTATION=